MLGSHGNKQSRVRCGAAGDLGASGLENVVVPKGGTCLPVAHVPLAAPDGSPVSNGVKVL